MLAGLFLASASANTRACSLAHERCEAVFQGVHKLTPSTQEVGDLGSCGDFDGWPIPCWSSPNPMEECGRLATEWQDGRDGLDASQFQDACQKSISMLGYFDENGCNKIVAYCHDQQEAEQSPTAKTKLASALAKLAGKWQGLQPLEDHVPTPEPTPSPSKPLACLNGNSMPYCYNGGFVNINTCLCVCKGNAYHGWKGKYCLETYGHCMPGGGTGNPGSAAKCEKNNQCGNNFNNYFCKVTDVCCATAFHAMCCPYGTHCNCNISDCSCMNDSEMIFRKELAAPRKAATL